MNSLCFDFVARQKLGGTHLTYFIMKQLPVLPPKAFLRDCLWNPRVTLADWVCERVAELTLTADDMMSFGDDLGRNVAPSWDEERRFRLRCELDAAFFHLFGLGRSDVEQVIGTFPIVERKDRARFGTFRTRDTVLRFFDDQARATLPESVGAESSIQERSDG